MGILDLVLGGNSVNEVRVSNFRDCVAESPDTTLVDDDARGTLTVRIHPDSSVSDNLARLLDTSHISFVDLFTEDRSAYLLVNVN